MSHSHSIRRLGLTSICLLAWCITVARAQTVWLDELDASAMSSGWGIAQTNKSIYGKPMRIGGGAYARGIGTHAISTMLIDLENQAVSFAATVGVDDGAIAEGTIRFYVIGDKKVLWDSGPMKKGEPAKDAKVNLAGVRLLGLLVTDAGDGNTGDLADWCDASITFSSSVDARRITLLGDGVSSTPDQLTPGADVSPRINGPRYFAFRPGNPCLYKVPVSGAPPFRFSVEKLPAGLSLDPATGVMTGMLREKGVYPVTLVVANSAGTARATFRIVVSDQIAVTPPLGWSSWPWFGETISDAIARNVAEAFESSGLAAHGWSYLCIDDSWQDTRDATTGAILPNERFPDMRALGDFMHARGFRLGLSSTPWITSFNGYCGGSSDKKNGVWSRAEMSSLNFQREGSHTFEESDARQWAAWGVDYLKYEWYPVDMVTVERMRRALYSSGRDIVYHLTGPVSAEQAQDWARLSNLWRMNEDLTDTWTSIRRFIARPMSAREQSGPGRWNDPGPLMIGMQRTSAVPRMTRLKPDEQYAHVSMWALLSAPMTLICDPLNLDGFTRNLLTNDEVLAVDQDPLGRTPHLAISQAGLRVWRKPLEDGSIAVGIFHIGADPASPDEYFSWDQSFSTSMTIPLQALGCSKPVRVRDLWAQKDLGVKETEITVNVPHHGVVLLRLTEL
jgi:alpha-galactosidase